MKRYQILFWLSLLALLALGRLAFRALWTPQLATTLLCVCHAFRVQKLACVMTAVMLFWGCALLITLWRLAILYDVTDEKK
ncbi:MAG: hypothetical protein Q4G03_05260 [Planctomycetia bacterium]|nr:hypothetical protein [Planctomycetia bacterium]